MRPAKTHGVLIALGVLVTEPRSMTLPQRRETMKEQMTMTLMDLIGEKQLAALKATVTRAARKSVVKSTTRTFEGRDVFVLTDRRWC